jgi:hypothetical protein
MNKTIASLALLKVNWDNLKQDYIENFVPFVVALINRAKYDVIDANKICKDFEVAYGLIIPYHPVVSILTRAIRRGYITRSKKGIYNSTFG